MSSSSPYDIGLGSGGSIDLDTGIGGNFDISGP